MIGIYTGIDRARHRREMAEIFYLRKRVFHDLLGWEVNVEDAWETDHFDQANPIYFASYAPDTGRLRGALRLLPTQGPNMLNDTFPVLLGDSPPIHDVAVWESSRFCIDPDISQDRASNQVTVAAAELMCGVGEMALASGITGIVTVTDVFLERMFRRMGCPGTRIGAPAKIGKVTAVAIAWQVDEAMLATMKSLAGIEGSLLERPVSAQTMRQAA
jgi:acyl homoserine lactone synthase